MNQAQRIFTEYRKDTGLNQLEFARAMGLSQGQVSLIEAGTNQPTADIILRILEKQKKKGK